MDTRTNPPAYLDFELVTAENFQQHLLEITEALHLPLPYFQKMLDGRNLDEFRHDLDMICEDSIAMTNKSIAGRATALCDEPEMQLYLDHKDQCLQTLLSELEQYLTTKKQTYIDQQSTAIHAFLAKVNDPREFHAGNYARKLSVLKKNLAIALQQAAYYLPSYWPDVCNAPDAFNAVFLNIAHMNEQGRVTLDASAPDAFARLDLASLQDRLCAILSTAHQHKNAMVKRVISDFIVGLGVNRSAKIKNGTALFDISYDMQYQFTFTPMAREIEKLAIDHAQQARQFLSTLDKEQNNIISDYENDLGKLDIFQRIRHVLTDSENSMTSFRNIISRVKSLTPAIRQDINEVNNQISQLEEIIDSEPNYHRRKLAQSLTELGFEPVIQQQLLQQFQDKQKRIHQEFLEKNKLDFQRQHYSMLTDQFRILQIELDQLLKDAAVQMPPLDNHRRHLDDIDKRRKSLQESLNDLYQLVDNTEKQYKTVKAACKQVRVEFLAHVRKLPENAKHEPAAQQLEAIPHPKHSFWTRNSARKRTMMGLLAGFGAAVLFTAAVAATIFSLDAFTLLGNTAVAGILAVTALVSGAGGNVIGEFIHDKIMSRFHHQRDVFAQQRSLSNNAKTFKTLCKSDSFFDDVPESAEELSFDSSSDEREEVVRDYSKPTIYEDYSAESSPLRQRLT